MNDIEDMKFKLIQNLAKYRQFKGLTQKEISEITGMSQQAVSRIEKYGNEPSLGNLLKYMKALDLDINDIFKNTVDESTSLIKDLNGFEEELEGKSFDELIDLLVSLSKIDEGKYHLLSEEELKEQIQVVKNKMKIIKSKILQISNY